MTSTWPTSSSVVHRTTASRLRRRWPLACPICIGSSSSSRPRSSLPSVPRRSRGCSARRAASPVIAGASASTGARLPSCPRSTLPTFCANPARSAKSGATCRKCSGTWGARSKAPDVPSAHGRQSDLGFLELGVGLNGTLEHLLGLRAFAQSLMDLAETAEDLRLGDRGLAIQALQQESAEHLLRLGHVATLHGDIAQLTEHEDVPRLDAEGLVELPERLLPLSHREVRVGEPAVNLA